MEAHYIATYLFYPHHAWLVTFGKALKSKESFAYVVSFFDCYPYQMSDYHAWYDVKPCPAYYNISECLAGPTLPCKIQTCD